MLSGGGGGGGGGGRGGGAAEVAHVVSCWASERKSARCTPLRKKAQSVIAAATNIIAKLSNKRVSNPRIRVVVESVIETQQRNSFSTNHHHARTEVPEEEGDEEAGDVPATHPPTAQN